MIGSVGLHVGPMKINVTKDRTNYAIWVQTGEGCTKIRILFNNGIMIKTVCTEVRVSIGLVGYCTTLYTSESSE